MCILNKQGVSKQELQGENLERTTHALQATSHINTRPWCPLRKQTSSVRKGRSAPSLLITNNLSPFLLPLSMFRNFALTAQRCLREKSVW